MPPVRNTSAGAGPPQTPSNAETGSERGPRKLIRSSLSEVRREHGLPRATSSRKSAPLDHTNAEAFYYQKQMQAKTPMVVRLLDGEEIRGWIEWYDKDVLKVNREDAPNLLIQKHAIKYLFKLEDERKFLRGRARRARTRPADAETTPPTPEPAPQAG